MPGFKLSNGKETEPPRLPRTVADALVCASTVRVTTGGHLNRSEVALELLAQEVWRLTQELNLKKRKVRS